MKVTIQYYDKEAKTRKAVEDAVQKQGYALEPKDDFFQAVTVPNAEAAKSLMTAMQPIANIQIQTAA